jgi:uncharacterized protein YdeI (YjbR/CyaY-like superfamily)
MQWGIVGGQTDCKKEGMADQRLPGGTVHALPGDLEAALLSDPEALASWHDITPLARNEWICWVTSPKRPETRIKRIAWGCETLGEGKRRPCCWPGCPHRGGAAAA